MGTAKNPDLGHVHPFMAGMGVSLEKAGMGVSLGTAGMGGTPVESRGQVATLVTLITGTVVQRAETRTSEVTLEILHTGDYRHAKQLQHRVLWLRFDVNLSFFHTAEMTMTDTTGVVLKTITGGRMSLIGILIEIPGMDAVSPRVCVLVLNHHVLPVMSSVTPMV